MTVEHVIQGSPQEAHNETVTVERMIQGSSPEAYKTLTVTVIPLSNPATHPY